MPPCPLLTFDMDGVLCRPPFGINPGSTLDKPRDRPGTRGLLWRTERWRYAFRRPMPAAPAAFRRLSEQYECRVLTARSEVARDLTERWFERWFGVVPVIHMRADWHETPAQFKTRTITELGASAHFEDDPFTARWVSELVPAVFVVDWRRNRALEGANVYRIATIADAIPLLPRAIGLANSDTYAI